MIAPRPLLGNVGGIVHVIHQRLHIQALLTMVPSFPKMENVSFCAGIMP
jgi:hypothetical protein